MANYTKKPDECTKTQLTLCGEVKEKVLARQAKELEKNGRRISYPDAINKLILGK